MKKIFKTNLGFWATNDDKIQEGDIAIIPNCGEPVKVGAIDTTSSTSSRYWSRLYSNDYNGSEQIELFRKVTHCDNERMKELKYIPQYQFEEKVYGYSREMMLNKKKNKYAMNPHNVGSDLYWAWYQGANLSFTINKAIFDNLLKEMIAEIRNHIEHADTFDTTILDKYSPTNREWDMSIEEDEEDI